MDERLSRRADENGDPHSRRRSPTHVQPRPASSMGQSLRYDRGLDGTRGRCTNHHDTQLLAPTIHWTNRLGAQLAEQ